MSRYPRLTVGVNDCASHRRFPALAAVWDDGLVARYMWLIWLVGSAVLIWALAQRGVTATIVLLALGLLFVAFWLSPFYGGISRKEREVRALPAEQRRCIVYWRPADIFSTRLRGGLGKHAKAFIWINVWQDRDAERRAVELGEGIYPVVVIDDEVYVNPDPRSIIPLV